MAATLSPGRLATVGAMRLAISCGYAGMGLGNDTLDLVQEAERLGYAQAWVAEAYGSDAPTVLAWLGGPDLDDRARGRRHADPGAHPGDDGDDRRDARHPVRRAVPPRARGVRAAGERGLARGAVRGAAGPHPRVRRDRADGAAPRAGDATPGDALHAAAARRAGQGAAAHHPARRAPTCRSTSRRSGRATCAWPARSPTAGSASSSRPSTRPTSSPRCGPGARRWAPVADGDPMAGFDVVATVPVVVTDDLEAARAAVAGYTALYIGGMGSREQNFYNRARPAHGLRRGRRRDPGPLPRRPSARRGGCRAVRPRRLHRPDRAPGADRRADRPLRRRRGHHAQRRALRARPRRSGPGCCARWRTRWPRWPETRRACT